MINFSDKYLKRINSIDSLSGLIEYKEYLCSIKDIFKCLEDYASILTECENKIKHLKVQSYSPQNNIGKIQMNESMYKEYCSLLEQYDDDSLIYLFRWLLENKNSEILKENITSDENMYSQDDAIKEQFKTRYGSQWKNVFYATAWKLHKKENSTLSEEEIITEAEKKNPRIAAALKFAKNRKKSKEKEESKKVKTSKKGTSSVKKGKGLSGKNSAAAKRFWSYDSSDPKKRKHPEPRKAQQTGENPSKIDGNLKGRFKRYYGAKGEKSKNGAASDVIRARVAKLIAAGKWPTPNAKKALEKGRTKGRGKSK